MTTDQTAQIKHSLDSIDSIRLDKKWHIQDMSYFLDFFISRLQGQKTFTVKRKLLLVCRM